MALQLDPSSGLPLDPATLQMLQEQQLAKGVALNGGNARERQNDMTISRGINTAFPSLEVRQANAAQDALKSAQVTQNPGESDLDFSMRQLAAQRDAVTSVDPNAAAAMNTQLLKLGQMKLEQQHLVAQDQREQQTFDAQSGTRAEQKATGALAYAITPDKTSNLGYTAQAYDTSDPAQLQALQQAARQRGVQIMSADKAAQLFNSSNNADMKLAGELARAAQQKQNGMLPDEAIAQSAVDSILNPQLIGRLTPSAKGQIELFYRQTGITPADQASARVEYKAMMSAAGQTGRREGNIKILQNSLGAMGQQVVDSMQGLTRTDFTPLNGAIMRGKLAFSDPGENRYAAAVQTFVNEYARLIAGGTGSSTEGARKEAWDTLSKYSGPGGIKAAIQQMATRETQIVMSAGDMAREYFAHPSNYQAITKIQQRAGLGLPFMSNADLAVTAPSQTPPPAVPTAAPQPPTFKSEADIPPGFKGRAIVNGVAGTVQ